MRAATLPTAPFAAETARRHLTEVRSELGFTDLLPHAGPHPALVKQFAAVIPKRATEAADRWANHGSHFTTIYEALRAASTTAQRARLLAPVRRHPASTRGWWRGVLAPRHWSTTSREIEWAAPHSTNPPYPRHRGNPDHRSWWLWA